MSESSSHTQPSPAASAAQGVSALLNHFWRPALSILGLILIVLLVWPLLQWAVFDAYWAGSDGSACPDKAGACWPFIAERFDQLMYGAYPEAQRWRVNLGLTIGLIMMVPILIPRIAGKAIWVSLFIFVYKLSLIGWSYIKSMVITNYATFKII